MFVNSDFSELLQLLNNNNVKYLVIGGYAFIQYAEPRYTKDLDLWISTTIENATAVFKSLKEFGAPLVDMSEIDFAEDGYFYQMGVPPVRVDILMGIPGVEFEKAWDRRFKVDFNGNVVKILRWLLGEWCGWPRSRVLMGADCRRPGDRIIGGALRRCNLRLSR